MTPESNHMTIDEIAALYAAGALSPSEVAEVDSRLSSGDTELADALRGFSRSTEVIGDAAGEVAPPTSIKSRLMDRIKNKTGGSQSAYFFQTAANAHWDDIGIRGAKVRTLFVDRDRGIKTFLLRMEPGCQIPAHPHSDVEECYVIQGDIFTNGKELRAGDYVRAAAGSEHEQSYSRNGCLLLITAGLDEHDLN